MLLTDLLGHWLSLPLLLELRIPPPRHMHTHKNQKKLSGLPAVLTVMCQGERLKETGQSCKQGGCLGRKVLISFISEKQWHVFYRGKGLK